MNKRTVFSKRYVMLACKLLVLVIAIGLSSGCTSTSISVSTPILSSLPTNTPLPPKLAPVTPNIQPEVNKNVFVFATWGTFPNIDPSYSFSEDLIVLANVYESLTFYNPPGSAEVLGPSLATNWETNEDATEWTFYLRQGVKFHDGTEFNAEAVKYSIERTRNLGQGAAFVWAPVKEIQVIDDYTIKFYLTYPAPLDLIAAAGYAAWIFSPACTEAQGEAVSEWFNAGHDCGSGPYMMKNYKLGESLEMARFDDYWGGWRAGQFDEIVFEIVVDPLVRQQMIELGAADMTANLARENLTSLGTDEELTAYTNPSFQNLLGLFNMKKEPTNNKLVRQALSYAFPYQQFIEKVMLDQAQQAYGPVPTGMWSHSEDLFQYTYDLDKAKDLLAKAGYPEGGFDLVMTYNISDPDQGQVGKMWKEELAKLGVNLVLQPMEFESQWDLAKSDPNAAQDILVMYWWPTWMTPYDFLFNMFHCEEQVNFNLGYYCNAEFDGMIDKANELSGYDRAGAEQLFIDAQGVLVEDAAAMFFYDLSNKHVLRTDVKGYLDNPAYPNVAFVYKLWRE